MNEKLQAKIDLIADNYITVSKSGRLDMTMVASLGALLFTAENVTADEQKIRDCRKILKDKTGVFSNFRGYTNLATLCRMTMQEDPEAWLDSVLKAYECVAEGKAKLLRSESLVLTAMAIAAQADPADYQRVANEAWELLHKMSEVHPLLTGQEDLTVAAMMVMGGLDADAVLAEAEDIYERLKPTSFKLNKDVLQSISMIMALSDKPVEEKCAWFASLRQALKDAGHKLAWDQLAVLAAFVNVDATIPEIVEQIAAADDELKHRKGFGMMTCGAGLRRLYCAALVLQTYNSDAADIAADQANALVSLIVQQITAAIILAVIIASMSANSSN